MCLLCLKSKANSSPGYPVLSSPNAVIRAREYALLLVASGLCSICQKFACFRWKTAKHLRRCFPTSSSTKGLRLGARARPWVRTSRRHRMPKLRPSAARCGESDRVLRASSSSRSSRFCFRTVCSFIIVNELAERLAYYGLQASLVLFLTRELKFATGEKRKLRDRSRLNSLSWSQLRRTCKRRSLTACATLHHCWGHGESAYQAVASRSADRSFLVGRLADSTLGRYRAIGVFITIYFVGMVLVSISARPSITCVCVYL